MLKTGSALAALALLGACGSPDTAPVENRVKTTIRNEYHERMLALSELQRGAALRNAIRSSKERCDRVEASAFQADHENLKMWTAKCQSSTYAVFLAPTGDVQVRPCDQAAALKLPACVEPVTTEEAIADKSSKR